MIGTGSLAQTGNLISALNVKQVKQWSWIVDYGASDHMMGDVSILRNYKPSNEGLIVRIVDGSLSKVVGIGSVCISNQLTLNSVLFLPKLDCNLLSINKLTHDWNCSSKFLPNLCEF